MQREALRQRREVHVQHHHDEQEQHRDGAHIDDHQQHRQELRPTSGRSRPAAVKNAEDQAEHRVHGLRAETTQERSPMVTGAIR